MFSLIQIQMITHRNIYRYLYIPWLAYTHISLLCQLRGPRNKSQQQQEYPPHTQLSNSLSKKGTRLLGEMANSMQGVRYLEDEPGVSYYAKT